MTENEISKALRCCAQPDPICKECPCYDPYLKYPCADQLKWAALNLIDSQKAEIERLEYTLLGVMHSVDKWLDGEELKLNEVGRAAAMREKTLQIIESRDAEIALLKSKFAAFKQSLIDRLRALATTKFDWNDYVDVADIVDVCDKILVQQRETTEREDATDARR